MFSHWRCKTFWTFRSWITRVVLLSVDDICSWVIFFVWLILRINILIWPQTNIFAGHTKLVKRELVRRCGGTAATRQKHPAQGFSISRLENNFGFDPHAGVVRTECGFMGLCVPRARGCTSWGTFTRGGEAALQFAVDCRLANLLLPPFRKICSWIAWSLRLFEPVT